MLAECGEHAEGYFLRHWLRGPHLRLNFRCAPDAFDSAVAPSVHRAIGEYLRTNPSTRHIDVESMRPLHERLAELESVTGPLEPWFPDNSIDVVDYEDRSAVMFTQDAVDLLHKSYLATTELAFRVLDRVRQRRASLLGIAFDLMLAWAHRVSPYGHIRDGFMSYRSNAEAFLAFWPEARGQRPEWDAHYARHRDILVARVESIIAELDPLYTGPRTIPLVHDLLAAVLPVRAEAEPLVADQRVRLPADDESFWGESLEPAYAVPPEERSPYWERVNKHINPNIDWVVHRRSSQSTLHRVLFNHMLLFLTRLGISPQQRFMLCHLTANAVEDLTGESAIDRFGP